MWLLTVGERRLDGSMMMVRNEVTEEHPADWLYEARESSVMGYVVPVLLYAVKISAAQMKRLRR